MNNSVIEQYKIHTQDTRSDVWEYLPFLRSVAKGIVVEIGTRWGLSTTALLAGLQDIGGHLYSIDIGAYCANLYPGHSQWTFILANSVDDKSAILEQLPKQIDVLFIDGDHSYSSALSDMETYGCLVKDGGLILAHDVNPDGITEDLKAAGWEPSPGARKAFDEYAAKHPDWESEILPGRAGLGVLKVRRMDGDSNAQ